MQKKLKRILITGATGFLGKNLVDYLAKRYELICIIRDRSYKRNDVKVIYGDITDENCIRRAMNNIYAIVHIAAILDPFDKNITKINVDSTRLLVNTAKVNNVKKFIFISTENVLHDLDDEYSTTKRAAEKIVKSFKNYLILRPTTIYGRYEERFVKKLVNLAKKYNVVPVPGYGGKKFQPVYVDDVVKCIENGIKYNVKGVYVVAGPSKITYDDFVSVLLEELGVKTFIIHIPLGVLKLIEYLNKRLKIIKLIPFQVKSLEIDKVYDIEKSKNALKYNPTPLITGMRRTLKFLKGL